jgi:hypothetical protein
MRVLPALVGKLAYTCDAWIIGPAAAVDADMSTVRDFDVLVPPANWLQAAQLIPPDARPNTYGGWKCQSEGREVDVWPEDLGKRLPCPLNKFAWHPSSGARFQRV